MTKIYKVTKIKFKGKIKPAEIKNLKGYDMKPKNNHKDVLEVDKVSIVKPQLIKRLLLKKIYMKMEKILTEFDDNEDPTPGDLKQILDEVEKMRGIIVNKYRKFMSDAEIEDLLNKTNYLLQEVAVKAIEKEEHLIKRQIEEYGLEEKKEDVKTR